MVAGWWSQKDLEVDGEIGELEQDDNLDSTHKVHPELQRQTGLLDCDRMVVMKRLKMGGEIW